MVLNTILNTFFYSYLPVPILQTHIFCIVRENPDMKGNTRIRATLVQYGILSPNPTNCPDEMMLLETKFNNGVTAIKGQSR